MLPSFHFCIYYLTGRKRPEAGVVVTGIGLDHYYRDPEIDLKTFALVNVTLEELERKNLSQ